MRWWIYFCNWLFFIIPLPSKAAGAFVVIEFIVSSSILALTYIFLFIRFERILCSIRISLIIALQYIFIAIELFSYNNRVFIWLSKFTIKLIFLMKLIHLNIRLLFNFYHIFCSYIVIHLVTNLNRLFLFSFKNLL